MTAQTKTPPKMIVEIVFADDRTEHIEVRDGDDPAQLARAFLGKYKLPASYERVLREQIVASIAEDERQRRLKQPVVQHQVDEDDEESHTHLDAGGDQGGAGDLDEAYRVYQFGGGGLCSATDIQTTARFAASSKIWGGKARVEDLGAWARFAKTLPSLCRMSRTRASATRGRTPRVTPSRGPGRSARSRASRRPSQSCCRAW